MISMRCQRFLKWKRREGKILENNGNAVAAVVTAGVRPSFVSRVSFWINLTWDCMVRKQTQNNFLTKLLAKVAEEMEGEEQVSEGALNSQLHSAWRGSCSPLISML